MIRMIIVGSASKLPYILLFHFEIYARWHLLLLKVIQTRIWSDLLLIWILRKFFVRSVVTNPGRWLSDSCILGGLNFLKVVLLSEGLLSRSNLFMRPPFDKAWTLLNVVYFLILMTSFSQVHVCSCNLELRIMVLRIALVAEARHMVELVMMRVHLHSFLVHTVESWFDVNVFHDVTVSHKSNLFIRLFWFIII